MKRNTGLLVKCQKNEYYGYHLPCRRKARKASSFSKEALYLRMGKQAWSSTEIQVRLGCIQVLTHTWIWRVHFWVSGLSPVGSQLRKRKKEGLSVILSKD